MLCLLVRLSFVQAIECTESGTVLTMINIAVYDQAMGVNDPVRKHPVKIFQLPAHPFASSAAAILDVIEICGIARRD